jgi:hypothetical protein
MYHGKLLVSGKNHIDIQLSDRPDRVIIKWEGAPTVTPCDHNEPDKFGWHILKEKRVTHHHHGGYSSRHILRINWEVTGIREIVWKIYF